MTTPITASRAPYADMDTSSTVGNAVEDLIAARHPHWAGDLLLELHALASLRLQIDAELAGFVSDARQAGIDWTEIAEVLGISADQARRDYEGRGWPAGKEAATASD